LEPVEILPVENGRDLRRFMNLPRAIYRGDPFWVAPLAGETKKLLDRSRHPFFAHSTADFFLAQRRGECVGRIAAILNRNHNLFHNERTAFFGFFESIHDGEVAGALLDCAARWARDRGMTELRGPVSYSTNETAGLLVEGFDSSPSILMAYNPVYYSGLLEAAGFEKAMDLYAWWMLTESGLNTKIVRVGQKVLKDEGVQIRTVRMDRFWDEVGIIKRIYNDAWSNNWGFVPMTDAEFSHLARDLKTIVDPRVVLIAEKDGKPAGFSLAIPDFNQALKKIHGRLFPIGLPLLVYHARHIRKVRVLALGIAQRVQNFSGLGAALYYESFRRGVEAGYRTCEFSWTLENNELINRSMLLFGARIYKRYRIYRKDL
jgi:hypothetical protein